MVHMEKDENIITVSYLLVIYTAKLACFNFLKYNYTLKMLDSGTFETKHNCLM